MQDNFNTYSLIQEYLNGDLSNEKKLAFEKEMELNKELQTLVNEYSMVDMLIEQNEIANIKNKLTKIHTKTIRRKNIIKGIIGISIIIVAVLAIIYFPKKAEKELVEKIAIPKESTKVLSLLSEPTPFKIIDSMSEVELSSSMERSKENSIIISDIDTVITIKPEIIINKPINTINTTKPASPKNVKTNPKEAEVANPDKQNIPTKTECKLLISNSFIEVTNSCSEKRTGVILFTKTDSEFTYSIDNKENYSASPYFNYLEAGNYFVSIKKGECVSNVLEIKVKGYQCNFVIEPERLVYFEKSLDKFQNKNTVEIFILNRNGNLVYNRTVSTSEIFTWDGKSNTNFPTPMGNYTYLIKSGKKISQGEITIIR